MILPGKILRKQTVVKRRASTNFWLQHFSTTIFSFRGNWTCHPTSLLMPETSSSKYFSPAILNFNKICLTPQKGFLLLHIFLVFRKLLKRQISQRLGSGLADADPIKTHPFFKVISFFFFKSPKNTFRPIYINDAVLIAHKLGGCDSKETGATLQTCSCLGWRCQVGAKIFS